MNRTEAATIYVASSIYGPKLIRRGGLRRRRDHNGCIDRRQANCYPRHSSEKLLCLRRRPVGKPMDNALPSVLEEVPKKEATLTVLPAYEHATRQWQNYDAVRIQETGTRCGRGVFSTRDFEKSHRIIVESPAVSCIHWMQRNGRRTIAEEWVKLPVKNQAQLKTQFARKLKDIPIGQSLLPEHRKQLESFINEYGFWDPQRVKAHIYILASHINHACTTCANAEQWTDSESPHLIIVRLVKPLKKGDELLINYNRQNLSFGCAACTPSFKDRCKSLGSSIFR